MAPFAPHETKPYEIRPREISAAVLAGGAGSRLEGRDKGLQTLAGRPLIEHVLASLGDAAGTILICANRNPQRYAAYGHVLADGTTDGEFRGPLAGIAAALAACTTPWLLTLPVDCPRPPPDLCARLVRAIGDAALAVAYDGAQVEPLFALYSRRVAPSAAAALCADRPVWRWQQELGAVPVDFSDCPGAFDNLNTAQDFAHWERDHERD